MLGAMHAMGGIIATLTTMEVCAWNLNTPALLSFVSLYFFVSLSLSLAHFGWHACVAHVNQGLDMDQELLQLNVLNQDPEVQDSNLSTESIVFLPFSKFHVLVVCEDVIQVPPSRRSSAYCIVQAMP